VLQRVERKLAAIVAADVAGYSRLMGVDEVGTARRLRASTKPWYPASFASIAGAS
jgi:adenylate cyclase